MLAPDPDTFCAEADRKSVRVYTPHFGIGNPYNRDVMATPGTPRWTLEGYIKRNGTEVAVWRSTSFRDPGRAAELINGQHHLRQNHQRLFVLAEWTAEDERISDFVREVWEDGSL